MNVSGQEVNAFGGVEVNHDDAIFAEPVNAAAKVNGLSDNHGGDSELTDETAAIPTRGQGGDHDFVTIGALTPGAAEGIGFAVDGGIVILDAAVVAASQEVSLEIEQGRADRYAALREALASFGEGDMQHLGILGGVNLAKHQRPQLSCPCGEVCVAPILFLSNSEIGSLSSFCWPRLLGDWKRMGTYSGAPELTDSSTTAREGFALLESEMELERFVAAWKAGRLPKKEWTHAAHVAMAAYFAFDHATEATFAIMKTGILHHNAAVGTANTEDNGYHETLTRFWASEIGEFVHAGRFGSRLEAVRGAVGVFGNDRDRFRMFYSFDVVKNRRARREWVPPDLTPAH